MLESHKSYWYFSKRNNVQEAVKRSALGLAKGSGKVVTNKAFTCAFSFNVKNVVTLV